MIDKKIVTIGLAKETESPENPGGLEKRVNSVYSKLTTVISRISFN